MDLKFKIDKYESDLKSETDTIEDLKFVLRTITEIQQVSDTVEATILDVRERYRTLVMYRIEVSDEEKDVLEVLQPKWEQLFLSTKHRDVGLSVIKEHFTDITQDQISDFGVKNKVFAEKFALTGPGSVGEDLDHGLKLMKVCNDG